MLTSDVQEQGCKNKYIPWTGMHTFKPNNLRERQFSAPLLCYICIGSLTTDTHGWTPYSCYDIIIILKVVVLSSWRTLTLMLRVHKTGGQGLAHLAQHRPRLHVRPGARRPLVRGHHLQQKHHQQLYKVLVKLLTQLSQHGPYIHARLSVRSSLVSVIWV